jgi:hypothetical protein
MTLSEKYKHLDVFKPYFILWLNLTYNEKGEPWIIKIMEDQLSREDFAKFKSSVLEYHKDLIEINHSILDIQKRSINMFTEYGRLFA